MTTFQWRDLSDEVKAFIEMMRENPEVVIEDGDNQTTLTLSAQSDQEPLSAYEQAIKDGIPIKPMFNMHPGAVTYISDDFDDPLPDEFWFDSDDDSLTSASS